MSEEIKNCQNCKKEFLIEGDDFSFYEKIKVPPPTFCPLCRAQRRFTYRNERVLYKRKSEFTGKEIFSMFSPNSGIKVAERELWMGDEWNPMDYGRDYDFSKPFFTQFFKLLKDVPLKDMNVVAGTSSPYTFNITDPKNCYLVFNASYVEDCMYSHGMGYCRWCLDSSHIMKCENCYEGFWLTGCNNSLFSSMCENSFNMLFCKNCVGCQDCFGCVNLRNKSYCILNEQYSHEEYKKKIKLFNLSSYANLQKIRKETEEFWLKFPNKFIEGVQNTNVSGNYINHSRNVKHSLLVRESENMHYCQYAQELPGCRDCWDYSVWGDNTELAYECHACGLGAHNIKFCLLCQENAHNLEYSIFCLGNVENLFGCVGLRKKSYCILNKKYSKEEYGGLVLKIKKHMDEMPYTDKKGRIYKYGEYFPAELSPFAYATTLAQEYFHLSKEKIIENGFVWEEDSERNYKIDFEPAVLPDDIKDVQDDVLNKIIRCEHKGNCSQLCTTAFKIIPDELNFYRKMNLPLPRLCPNCRTFERLKQRTGIELYKRQCQCAGESVKNSKYKNSVDHFHGHESCPNEFETSYSPDRPEIVYCEKCYQQEVY